MFEINELLLFLCEGATEFDEGDFYRNIIPGTLKPLARVEYIKKGGKNLRDEDEILEILEEVMEGIEAELEVKHSAKRRKDYDNNHGNGKQKSNNNDGKKEGNWCRLHDGKHLWKNCPDNPNGTKNGDGRRRDDDRGRDRSRDRDSGWRNHRDC